MRALLVVNPKATTTTAGARDVLASALASQSRLEVVETKAPGHGEEVAAAAVGQVDVVVALGGDGTVNEVVNGLLGEGVRPDLPALAVVPGGSTNVLARALGLPNHPLEATSLLLEALRRERRRTIGLGRADDRWFTCNAGMGLDAAVVRRVTRLRASGRRSTPGRYLRATMAEYALAGRRRPEMTVERDGEAPERIGLALVCNTAPWTWLGSRPVDPCPRASFDAGLDLFALRRLRTAPTLRHSAQILSVPPRPHGRQVVGIHDARELVLAADTPQPFQLDGEDLGDRSRVVLTAVPAALQVVL